MLATTGHSDWPLAPPVFLSYLSAIKGDRHPGESSINEQHNQHLNNKSRVEGSGEVYMMVLDSLPLYANGRAKELWWTSDLKHPAAALMGRC